MTEFEPEVHACSLVMIAIQELLCEKTLDVMGRIIDKAEINEQNKKEEAKNEAEFNEALKLIDLNSEMDDARAEYEA